MRLRRSRIPLAAIAVVALGCAALHADVLVTRDGARVETRGPWKVDGHRVVFTLPNGTLSMMRADQIDLDASKLATARAAEAARQSAAPAAAPAAAATEPVMRITEKDIPPVDDPDAMNAEGGEATSAGDAKADTADEANAPPLQVVSWDQTAQANDGGVQIFGTVRNVGSNNVISPTVMVAVYGDDGGLLATADGIVNQSTIAGGQTANFRVELPGVINFASAKFNFSGRGYETHRPDLKADEGEGGAADTAAPAAGSEATPEETQPQDEPQATQQQEEAPPPAG